VPLKKISTAKLDRARAKLKVKAAQTQNFLSLNPKPYALCATPRNPNPFL